MTLPLQATSPLLDIADLAASHSLHCEDTGITVYPDAGVAFLDGDPVPLTDLDQLRIGLISATACVAAGAHQERSWDSPVGVITVTEHGHTVTINGAVHAPSTVVRYAEAVEDLVTAAVAATR